MLRMGVTGVWVCCPPAYYRRHNMKQPANTVCLNLDKNAIKIFLESYKFFWKGKCYLNFFFLCGIVSKGPPKYKEFLFYDVSLYYSQLTAL